MYIVNCTMYTVSDKIPESLLTSSSKEMHIGDTSELGSFLKSSVPLFSKDLVALIKLWILQLKPKQLLRDQIFIFLSFNFRK